MSSAPIACSASCCTKPIRYGVRAGYPAAIASLLLEASAAAPANAEVYRELVGIEARSTFPFQPGRWLADVSPRLLSPGLRSDVSRAKANQHERRRLEAAMPPGLRYVKGWPPRLPSKAEAEDIAAARRPILARHNLAERFPTASAVLDRFAELLATAARKTAR